MIRKKTAIQINWEENGYQLQFWSDRRSQVIVSRYSRDLERVVQDLSSPQLVWNFLGSDKGIPQELCYEYAKAKFQDFLGFSLERESFETITADPNYRTWIISRENDPRKFIISLVAQNEHFVDVKLGYFTKPTPHPQSRPTLLQNFFG